MNLRDEFLEFIRDRWTQRTIRILVPLTVLISIAAVILGRLDILWVAIYAFIILFILLNALYIMFAQEKMPAVVAANKGAGAQKVSKFSLLIPYARLGLIFSILLIPLFGHLCRSIQDDHIVNALRFGGCRSTGC